MNEVFKHFFYEVSIIFHRFAIHIAVLTENIEIIKLLLDHKGIDVNVEDNKI